MLGRLHIVFKDKASHGKYQEAEDHHTFIEEFEENWESVRVFDSWLTATAHVELGVAHREGEVLVILELTEEQRRRVAD